MCYYRAVKTFVKKTKKNKQTIFVGISGGVDSSVAAYLLKKDGHDVHGIFVKTWSPEWLPCTWVSEKRDAMRVCAALDIPFHFLDAEELYKREVAQYMIDEYKVGRTPNPDVLCNRVIKFGAMWDYAKTYGADAIATGHYAQTDGVLLSKAADPAKDQSYFLWMLKQEELSHVSFPIGHLQKKDVRAIASSANLFTATKKDSQGICFLGDVDMKDFLKHYIVQAPGIVVHEKGDTVGTHDGVLFYTLGERHGFSITEKGSDRRPYFVIRKDLEKNILVVSHDKYNIVLTPSQTVKLREVNWLQNGTSGGKYSAQIRYHGEFLPINIVDGNTVEIETNEMLPLGQSLVMYDENVLLGGGIIDKLI